jgi:hypothetical protein
LTAQNKKQLGDEYREVFHFEFLSDNRREKGQVRDYCQKLSERALQLEKAYPNKRFILHYMPPHRPYVDTNGDIVLDPKSTRELKRKGVRHQEYKDAYDTTVQYILNHIESVIEDLEGKTVVSADHGELLHEHMFPIPIRRYGHDAGVYGEELLKLPWFIIDWVERKEIQAEDGPSEFSEAGEGTMTTKELHEHLRDLGYKI